MLNGGFTLDLIRQVISCILIQIMKVYKRVRMCLVPFISILFYISSLQFLFVLLIHFLPPHLLITASISIRIAVSINPYFCVSNRSTSITIYIYISPHRFSNPTSILLFFFFLCSSTVFLMIGTPGLTRQGGKPLHPVCSTVLYLQVIV